MTKREISALVLVCLVSIGSALAVWAFERQSQQRVNVKITHAQIASCQRVNLIRRQFNQRGDALKSFLQGEINAYVRYLAAPPRPPGVPPPPGPSREPPERLLARQLIDTLTALVNTDGHVPVVDCVAVVQGG